MNDFTSHSLLLRVKQQNDAESWRGFADMYEKMIRRYLGGCGVSPNDVDDVVQEVLTFLSQHIAGFEHNGRPGAFRNWLRQVTANRLREFRRKHKRESVGKDLGELAEELADDNSGVSGVWQREHDRFVLEYLLTQVTDRFEPDSMSAFRKIMLEGKSSQAVAEELNMSPGAVRVAQSRVLKMLRKLGEGLID